MKEQLILTNDYVTKLKRYLNSSFVVNVYENKAIFYQNSEIEFVIDLIDDEYVFKMIERGKSRQIKLFKDDKKMKLFLAVFFKGTFESGLEYPCDKRFRGIDNEDVDAVKKLFEECNLVEYFTIDFPQKWKVNLQIENSKFDIFVPLSTGTNKLIESDLQGNHVFSRFYKEVAYLKNQFRKIREYEEVFCEKLDDIVIDSLL